jgi:hypothetical protein
MRREVAEKWSSQYQATITAEMINCTGCRMEGVKVGHWNECGIRLCAVSKGYEHCGECDDISKCANIKFVLDHVPDALQNLKSL